MQTDYGETSNDFYSVCTFTYSAAATPLYLNLSGPILDSSGTLNILIGQSCTSSLSPVPQGCTVDSSSYQWKVSNSASTFQSWAVVSDPNSQSHTAEVDGPGPLTNSTASWFWDEQIAGGKSAKETITCTATVAPPAGDGAAFPVTVTQPVNVVVPGWTSIGTGGAMQVNTALNGSKGNYFLYAGPADTSTPGRGMEWKATLSPLPAPFSGTGALELVQTETPNLTYTLSTGVVYNRSNNGQQGLDTTYDYGWDQPSTAPTYTADDSPNISLTGVTSAQLVFRQRRTARFISSVLTLGQSLFRRPGLEIRVNGQPRNSIVKYY